MRKPFYGGVLYQGRYGSGHWKDHEARDADDCMATVLSYAAQLKAAGFDVMAASVSERHGGSSTMVRFVRLADRA